MEVAEHSEAHCWHVVGNGCFLDVQLVSNGTKKEDQLST